MSSIPLTTPSPLLAAALLGLTLAATPACGGDSGPTSNGAPCAANVVGAGGQAGAGGAGGASGGVAGSGGAAGGAGSGGAAGGAGSGGAAGAAGGKTGPTVTSETEDATMTFAKFVKLCKERGGFVQTHAACNGSNACKGVSYNKGDHILTEHTCKAMNTCAGMSCVETPKDQGRTGKQIYEKLEPYACSSCHGEDAYYYYVPKGTALDKAAADFPKRSRDVQAAIVAFGLQGINDTGTGAANMPPHHEALSRAEIERVVDYVHTLPLKVEEYGLLGVDEEVAP